MRRDVVFGIDCECFHSAVLLAACSGRDIHRSTCGKQRQIRGDYALDQAIGGNGTFFNGLTKQAPLSLRTGFPIDEAERRAQSECFEMAGF